MFQIAQKRISQDVIYAVAIIALAGLFVLANYFFGFNFSLYLVIMSAVFGIAVFAPRAGYYAIIFLTFIFERFFTLAPIVLGRAEYKLYPIDILLGGIILGIIAELAKGKIKLKLKKADWLMVIFFLAVIAYFAISMFSNLTDHSLAISSAKNYAFYPILYFVSFMLIDNKKHLKELGAVILAGAVGILWFVFYGLINGQGLWSEYTPLSTEGVRTLAFTHAFYLCMALIVAMVYAAYRSDRVSTMILYLTPFWIIGIIGSMMRHLWISLFFSAIVLILILSSNERRRIKEFALKYLAFTMLIAAMLFYGAALFPKSGAYQMVQNSIGIVKSRIVSVANTSGDESIVWRSEIWKQATKLYAKDPILGIGFGKLIPVEIGKYHDLVEARNIHNSFLVLLVQMGIFGIIPVAILVTVIFWKTLRSKFSDDVLQIASISVIGIMTLQVIAFMFQPYLEANLLGIFFWINLGITRSLLNQSNDQII